MSQAPFGCTLLTSEGKNLDMATTVKKNRNTLQDILVFIREKLQRMTYCNIEVSIVSFFWPEILVMFTIKTKW